MSKLAKAKISYDDLVAARAPWLTSSTPSATQGWFDTACIGDGTGVPYRNAVLSSDGFWTIDVQLDSFRIGEVQKPSGVRYVRLLIRPTQWGGGRAHAVADEHYITPHDRLKFSGAIVLERTSTSETVEIQPVDDLVVQAPPP